MKPENMRGILLVSLVVSIFLFGVVTLQQSKAIGMNSKTLLMLINKTEEITDVINDNLVRRNIVGTGSMRPLIMKNIYQNISTVDRILNSSEELYKARIYIYTREDPNGTVYIVHRLIGKYYIGNDTLYVFKGDNNLYVDEPVYRWQIIEEVIKIDLY